MHERITQLDISAFRGVRNEHQLKLDGGRSVVLLGENATGKSTIADALEWYFTGRIEYLAREGRQGGVRHTGAATAVPTAVRITTNGALGGKITPEESSPQAARDAGAREIFLLRGRTLADFVDKSKGEKWKALAEILGIEDLDTLRLDLQRARNELAQARATASKNLTERESAVKELSLPTADADLLSALAAQCEAAGIARPSHLEAVLDPKWQEEIVPKISPAGLSLQFSHVEASLRSLSTRAVSLTPLEHWTSTVKSEHAGLFAKLQLFQAAKNYATQRELDDACPLCGQAVEHEELETRIQEVLISLEKSSLELEHAKEEVRQVESEIRAVLKDADAHRTAAQALGVLLPAVPAADLGNFASGLRDLAPIDHSSIVEALQDIYAWASAGALAISIAAPEPATERERALVKLGGVFTSVRDWRAARTRYRAADSAYAPAVAVHDAYQKHEQQFVQAALDRISSRVAELYAAMHREGGIGLVAVEIQGEKGLELSVEFHGKKEQPPHRVLSESHLNSLGLALFLAMAETFNEGLGFIVLDDVVNSFDREHRGALARLLVDQFEGRQLIVLTHDEQFFQHLSRRAPSWIREEFTGWSYDDGPRTRRHRGDRLLDSASESLASGDRIGAASKARRGLEEFLQETCEALEALVPFRRGYRNEQRMSDELLGALRRILKDSAREFYRAIDGDIRDVEAELQATLNTEAHASRGAASHEEISTALGAVRRLQAHFTCLECETRFWQQGDHTAGACKCGKLRWPPAGA